MPTITCINNANSGDTTTESSWIVDSVGDGTILCIISGSEKDSNGIVLVKYKHTYNINSSGDIISLKFVSEAVNGNIFTIESL